MHHDIQVVLKLKQKSPAKETRIAEWAPAATETAESFRPQVGVWAIQSDSVVVPIPLRFRTAQNPPSKHKAFPH